MKSAPEEYRQPTLEELDQLWRDASVVFDASALLRISEFSRRTSTACIKAMRALGDRLWLPDQAAFEFYKNTANSRRQVLEARSKLDDLLASMDVAAQVGLRSTRHPHLVDAFTDAWEKSKSSIRTAMNSADMPPGDLDAHFNALESVLSSLYDGKIGAPYDTKRSREIYIEGEERYKFRTPPGFEDAKKPLPDKFGDLIFWFQVLDHAKATSTPVILVTDDQKDDWWLRVQDRQRPDGPKQVVGAHPLLIREMRTLANQRLWMYTMSDFVAESRERLNVREADQAVVAEIKQLEAASDDQRQARTYAMMIDLRRRLDVARRGSSDDPYSQLQVAELLQHDLASWSETRSDSEKQEQRLLDTMGVGDALSQIPAFINVRQESVWLDREIARLKSELGLGK